MNTSDDTVDFFKFLKQNASLFTCCALFATFFYYVVTLLKDPNTRLSAVNATELQKQYSQLSPEVKIILDQVFSLQIAAVISFSIFAIILISIIIIAWRYGVLAKIFSFLMFFLLYFSFIYLYAAFKESIYGFIVMGAPIIIGYLYIEMMAFLQRKYKNNSSFDFGFYWFIIFDILLIIVFGAIPLGKYVNSIMSSLEAIYFLIFLVLLVVISIFLTFVHFMLLIMHLERPKSRAFLECTD